ncbi:histone-like nucleoid-structuring protein Lsr2 [Microbacterium testaceum]|uniref:histone-like nucleoid-structuring protein Lsr2 n=2 Tax=Microbacteriaceae TaxID=85023 RepID=UPI003D15FC9C
MSDRVHHILECRCQLRKRCSVLCIMAIKHITHLVDDLDGSVLEEGEGKQITFSVEGRAYEIDLSNRNADKFYNAIAPFVDAARSVSRTTTTSRRPRAARRDNDLDLGAVREWARANGHTVSDRGRVPAAVLEAYSAAQS